MVNDEENAPCVLWIVNIPEDPVVMELKDERYSKLIVDIANPKAAVELVKAGLPH